MGHDMGGGQRSPLHQAHILSSGVGVLRVGLRIGGRGFGNHRDSGFLDLPSRGTAGQCGRGGGPVARGPGSYIYIYIYIYM